MGLCREIPRPGETAPGTCGHVLEKRLSVRARMSEA